MLLYDGSTIAFEGEFLLPSRLKWISLDTHVCDEILSAGSINGNYTIAFRLTNLDDNNHIVFVPSDKFVGKPQPKMSVIDSAYLFGEHINVQGEVVSADRMTDSAGEHILALSRKRATHSYELSARDLKRGQQTGSKSGRYATVSSAPLWVPMPTSSPQPHLHRFDRDGLTEVIASYQQCSRAGADARIIKVIHRDGATKLAIRGHSLLSLPGQSPFGGEHKHDRALLSPAYSDYKHHLDQVWKSVSIDNRK